MFGLKPPLADADTLPALTLAWVGDAVYELYVRTVLLKDSKNPRTLSKAAVSRVNHGLQSRLLALIENELSEHEHRVVLRGRNTHGSVPKNGDVKEYRRATGVEALCGYLYLSGQEERLLWVLSQIDKVWRKTNESGR